jgi:hypothetical protein
MLKTIASYVRMLAFHARGGIKMRFFLLCCRRYAEVERFASISMWLRAVAASISQQVVGWGICFVTVFSLTKVC